MSLKLYQHLLVLCVLALLILTLLLFVFLLLQRVIASLAAAHAQRRRAALAPLLHRALGGRAAAGDLARALRSLDRPVIRNMLLRLAMDLTGEEANAIAHLYRDLGLRRSDLARLESRSRRRRATAATNLGALRAREALPALLLALSDADTHVRMAVVRAIGEVGNPAALAAVVPMLGDRSRAVARQAEDILIKQGREVVGEILTYTRATDSLIGRRAAVELLGWLRAPEATDLLLGLFDDPDLELRIKAVKAAAVIGDSRFLGPFHTLSQDPQWEIRCQALKGLRVLGSADSVERLQVALHDDHWWVRFYAALALADLGASGKVALQDALRDAQPVVRDMARYLLKRGTATPAPL